MKNMRIFILFMLIGMGIKANAKEYNASLFGIASNGTTNNTASIQKAIDYISEQGGGTLVFYVGRYLTGTVELRSNVYILLNEGAVLVGASSPYDYKGAGGLEAIIIAEGQSNIGVSGKGVIEGNGSVLIKNAADLAHRGYLKKDNHPGLIAFTSCTQVTISALHLWSSAYHALTLSDCKEVTVDGVYIDGKQIPSSAGVYLRGCKWITLQNLFVKVLKMPIVATDNQGLSIQNSITDDGKPLAGSLH